LDWAEGDDVADEDDTLALAAAAATTAARTALDAASARSKRSSTPRKPAIQNTRSSRGGCDDSDEAEADADAETDAAVLHRGASEMCVVRVRAKPAHEGSGAAAALRSGSVSDAAYEANGARSERAPPSGPAGAVDEAAAVATCGV
jgi:hypothetical protein